MYNKNKKYTKTIARDRRYEFIIKDREQGTYKPKGLGFTPNFTKKEVITNG